MHNKYKNEYEKQDKYVYEVEDDSAFEEDSNDIENEPAAGSSRSESDSESDSEEDSDDDDLAPDRPRSPPFLSRLRLLPPRLLSRLRLLPP